MPIDSTQAQVGRKLRDAISVLFAGYSTRGRLLALAAVASALQPQVRAALNHWEPELVDIVATTADCCAMIARRVSPPLVRDTSGGGGVNVQGEKQTAMDVFADTLLNDALRPLAKTLASEEADAVVASA